MADAAAGEVTVLLRRWSTGDEGARDELFPIVYDELREIAGHHMRGERAAADSAAHCPGQRSVPAPARTAPHPVAGSHPLLRLRLAHHAASPGRAGARARAAAKRGAGAERVPLDAALQVPDRDDLDLVELDAALEALAAVDPQKARIIELRFFGGLSVAETATVLRIAPATVKRHFAVAKVWLHRQLRDGAAPPPSGS